MAKIAYVNNIRLSKSNKVRLNEINEILEEYQEDGYTLTLRQLYYQLVSRDMIPNSDKEYAKLSNILKEGRMAGIVDWDAIEDRVRKYKLPYWCVDVEDALKDTVSQYRLNRMRGQEHEIEVWVEKDALSNVLQKVTEKYHIKLMVNRGYSSVTAMHEAAKRLSDGDTILYFGDHDPSGLDMIRDVKDRLTEFNKDINVVPIALTMEQIKKFAPPPNPAKITDSRAKWYIENYGDESWELDALPPRELIRLTESAILDRIDKDLYLSMLEKEKADKAQIMSIIKK